MNTTTLNPTAAPAARLSEYSITHAIVLERDMAVLAGMVKSGISVGQQTSLTDVLGMEMALILIRHLRQLGLQTPVESEFWAAMVGLGGELARHATEQMQAKLAEIERIAGTDPQDIARALMAHWEAKGVPA